MINNKIKILVFDLETAPITAYTWGIYDQHIGLNQIKADWFILSWAAKWYGEPASKTMYMDGSKLQDPSNDKKLVEGLWNLLDQADIVITQNGDKFDIKKFNARAIIHKLPPVGGFRSTDVMKESKKVFGFTSQSLEYTSNVLNTKYKKLKHAKFPGMELWTEILKGNRAAWKEMRVYCTHDVLATEEKYQRIQGWIKTQNLASYYEDCKLRCFCGSRNLSAKEVRRLASGHFQGYICLDCGKRLQSKYNLLSKIKKRSLLKEGK